jgi:probable FeS assembly SUF system protein SufT
MLVDLSTSTLTLRRACEVIEIPSGIHDVLPSGSSVRITQHLGTGYTVVTNYGRMYRVDAANADALGIAVEMAAPPPSPPEGAFSEEMVWVQLKTVYDPEIPVNIVDLGLVYSCEITPLDDGGKKAHIRMSMTAPGCGMSDVLKNDVETKLSRLPEVKQVQVDVVFDPPWHPGLMSEAAKLQLGFDL